ncbi:MAG: formate--tetrahydrofolate ligase [Bacteroidia bacterium]|nr:formate--tetrahydrofolate ligase [Bacteroidia bacterium]MCF8426799.1 formate--tetrahydrofolate ligase [Bacteroidia bacterium]
MKSDIEIAREVNLEPIQNIATKINISADQVEHYGKYKAKISGIPYDEKINDCNLILVTATTPNKSGSGKTTTSVALAQGLNKIGKRAIVALREPSLGPVFGMKGGAAGGGYSQVLPMEDINLHFTGDFHAITSANNTLAALIDNYQYFNRTSTRGLKQILWRRVLDVNDRSLRFMVSGLHGSSNGVPTETGFDITPASEIMAIFCLANSLDDLRARIENILIGYTYDNAPFFVKDLGVAGAIVTLLKDAFQPNLVQTIEGGAAFIHGGPFANIAHGCNSIMATKAAMQYGEYAVTEAGFGSDLGGEKFLNIKCRAAGIAPKASVLVTTTQSIKLHGKVDEKLIKQPNLEGLKAGIKNVERHIESLQQFGQTVILALNKFGFDTEEEINFIENWCKEKGAHFAINEGFARGGDGAADLARKVVEIVENHPSKPIIHTYEMEDLMEDKIKKIVTKVYKGSSVTYGKNAKTAMKKIKELGGDKLPVCIAKTQFSFTDNAALVGAAEGFNIHIENLVLNHGAGFVVAVAGEIMRMPGLPKEPAANIIDVVNGEIVNLS